MKCKPLFPPSATVTGAFRERSALSPPRPFAKIAAFHVTRTMVFAEPVTEGILPALVFWFAVWWMHRRRIDLRL